MRKASEENPGIERCRNTPPNYEALVFFERSSACQNLQILFRDAAIGGMSLKGFFQERQWDRAFGAINSSWSHGLHWRTGPQGMYSYCRRTTVENRIPSCENKDLHMNHPAGRDLQHKSLCQPLKMSLHSASVPEPMSVCKVVVESTDFSNLRDEF